MKKFKLFKMLAVLIVLITSINTAWADNCGYYGNGNTYIRLWVNGTKSVYLNCNSNGVSDLELGVVDALYLAEMRSLTWKWNTGNVCGIRMYYGVNATRNGTEGSNYLIGHNETDYGDWTGDQGDDKDKTIQQWRAWPSNYDLLDGLTPGQDYYLDFCFQLYGNKGGNSGCYEDQVALNNNGGNYHVHFRVADTKSTFTAGSYMYFDARTLTSWQTDNPDIQFFFKEYYYGNDDIADVKCLKTNALEEWVYYVTVPEGSRNGTVEIDRVRPAGSSDPNEYWNKTNYMYACDRSNASQNCLVGDGSDKWSSWSPTWSTYCPPKATSTISDNGTVKTWGGSGTSGSPYYVATGSSIKVSAASTNTLTDANMTTKYDFQVRNTSNVQQAHSDGTATTYSYTVPATNNVTYKVRVNAYNSYNSASSTDKWSDASEIYYTARTPYNIAYNKGSYGAEDNVTDVKLDAINITLRGVTFTRTGYTQTAWNTNSAGTGGTNYNLSSNYTSNAALTLYPTWTAKTTSVTLNPNTANHGTGSDLVVTATYDQSSLASFVAATPATGYTLEGYYTYATSGDKIVNADGSLVRNTTYTSNDATPVWKSEVASLTLYAHYTAKQTTVSFNQTSGDGGQTSNVTATYDAAMPTPITTPTRDNYTFDGYWDGTDGTGNKYYNANGSSAATWNKEDATYTLHAKWDEKLHNVTVAYKYESTSLHATGTVEDVGVVTTGDATAIDITGYDFSTWSAMPSDVQTSSSLTGRTITINATNDGQTITANYEPHVYSGDINKTGGTTDGSYTVTYKTTSLTATDPIKAGYKVSGYYLDSGKEHKIADDEGNLRQSVTYSETNYTNASYEWIYDGEPDLYVEWVANSITINLDDNKGGDATGTAGSTKRTVTMDDNDYSSITLPTRTGYTFAGYYASDGSTLVFNGDGDPVKSTGYIDGSSNWINASTVTLYAHWTANPYTITLNNEAATTAGSASISVTFDASTNLTGTPAITKPAKTGYTFGGYYTEVAGGGVQLIDADGNVIASASGGGNTYTNASKQWKYAGSINLYAKWTQTIEFDQNSADVEGTDELAATYNGALSTGGITNPKKIGYAFAGWATAASDGSVVIEPDGTVKDVEDWTEDGKWIHAGESELVATWNEDICTFTGAAGGTDAFDWDNAANWEGGKLPTDYSEVHLNYGVIIKEGESYHVGKIVIGESRTLTLFCGGVLEVAGTITKEGGTATDPTSISLSSTSAYQSALIFDNTAGNTQASVSLATSASYNPEHPEYSFQYVAVPMTSVDVSNTFNGQGIYTYVWNEGDGWERRGYYSSISGFEALGVTSKDGVYFGTSGTLVSTANIVDRPLAYTSGDGAGMNMIGNSWTAPIKISEMEITGNAESTVYVYNSSRGLWDGNPTAVSGDKIVPAMQAYLIKANSGGGYLSIDYDKAVRGVAASDRTAPLYAPRRSNSAGIAEIRMRVSDSEDYYSDLRLFENEQFTNEFDNGWEARYIAGEGFTGQLYAQADDKMTVLATPNLEGQVVGFVPGMATNYTISFEGDGEGYYLNDLDMQESTLIEEGNTYVFTPNESTNATRFVISKMPIHKTTTGNDAIYDGVKARKQMIDGVLYIIRDGRMYDATGALVK